MLCCRGHAQSGHLCSCFFESLSNFTPADGRLNRWTFGTPAEYLTKSACRVSKLRPDLNIKCLSLRYRTSRKELAGTQAQRHGDAEDCGWHSAGWHLWTQKKVCIHQTKLLKQSTACSPGAGKSPPQKPTPAFKGQEIRKHWAIVKPTLLSIGWRTSLRVRRCFTCFKERMVLTTLRHAAETIICCRVISRAGCIRCMSWKYQERKPQDIDTPRVSSPARHHPSLAP